MSRLLLLVSCLALILLGEPAANAATVRSGPSAGHFCVAQAVPAGSSRSAALTCYRTFADSIRAATRGRVSLPESAAPGSVTPAELNAGPAALITQFVLSIDYQNSNFTGNTLTWTQTSRCGSFQAGSMPSGWNDQISSVIASSGCATTLFWNSSFGSPTDPIARNGSAATLGVFNDQTSSQTWCSTYPCGR
jgi:hypothetical protein